MNLDEYLKKHYKKVDTNDIAKMYRVDVKYVRKRAIALGLSKPRKEREPKIPYNTRKLDHGGYITELAPGHIRHTIL